MEIVLLQSHTAHLLDNVADDVFDHPIDPRWLSLFVNCPHHQMLMAIDADRVIGMASGVIYYHPDKPPQLWINEVGVAESHRRRGIGRQLVTKLLEHGREQGCTAAWVGTETDNIAAQKLYASAPLTKPPLPFLMYEWDWQ